MCQDLVQGLIVAGYAGEMQHIKERKGKGNSYSKQQIQVLLSKNGGKHENFRHQAERDKTHPAQKERLRVKSKKKTSITFKKRTRNVR